MILEGKRLLITGVITRDSIAYHVAEQAQREGASVVLTSFGRVRRMTERAAKRLPDPPDVLELDVNKPEDFDALVEDLGERWDGRRRGAARDRVRARGRARGQVPEHAGRQRDAGVSDQRVLAEGAGRRGGPADAAGLEHRRAGLRRHRGLADLRLDGRRQGRAGVGLAVPGARPRRPGDPRQPGDAPARWAPSPPAVSRDSSELAKLWASQAPLGWDIEDPAPVASTICFLLSDYARAISGEIVHVDGGFHAVGAPTDL